MSFRFPLDSVLAYRKNLEHQQELRLHSTHQQVNRIRQKIADLDQETQRLMQSEAEQIQQGTTSAEISFLLAQRAALHGSRLELLRELESAQKRLVLVQQTFVEARRSREVLERLRERAREEYRIQTSRRAQREMDDLFLLRRAHRPNTN